MRREAAGISTVVIAVVVVVIVVVAGAGLYFVSQKSPATSTSTSISIVSSTPSTSSASSTSAVSTSSGTSSASISSSTTVTNTATADTAAVLAQVQVFAQTFNNRNVEGLANFYTSTSVVNWIGNTEGLGAVYSGQGNIRILYSASIGHTETFSFTPSNITTTVIGPNTVNVTMDADLVGTSANLGNITAHVHIEQQWVNSAGSLTIQKELWDYTSFTASNPITSTVFPQWGLQISGQNPDLSSEHVFEWNIAPYLASVVYAIIVGVAIFALVARNRRSKTKSN